MAGIISSANMSLPRDIDVYISVSKPQVEITTDLSVLGFFSNFPDSDLKVSGGFGFDSSRVRFYSTLTAVQSDFLESSEVYKAAVAFFSQNPRAKTFAVCRAFDTAQKGYLECGVLCSKVEGVTGQLSDAEKLVRFKLVTSGACGVVINGIEAQLTGLDFSAITALDGIATVLQTAINAYEPSDTDQTAAFENASVTLANGRIRITCGVVADNDPVVASEVGYLTSPAELGATDISGHDYLNGSYDASLQDQECYFVPGYDPLMADGTTWNVAQEANYCQLAASASGKFIFGWTLDAGLRETQAAKDFATWMEGQTYGILGLTTNDGAARTVARDVDTGIGAWVWRQGFRRTFVCYHNNPYYYPEVSILAYALSVNYAAANSTITTKFKSLQGIPTVPMTESELNVLTSKRINTYTLVGNNSRTFREGTESDSGWFIDDLINLDNFREELQVSVYNVFLRNKKVPYNADGVNLIFAAIAVICERYVRNGTFTERPLSEVEANERGYEIEPPYTIDITPIADMTVAERAQRIGPPATVIVNLAGAIHSISIAVEAYN